MICISDITITQYAFDFMGVLWDSLRDSMGFNEIHDIEGD
jgi:hypothetical protein